MEYWGDGRTLGWGACPERKPKDRWSRALYLNLLISLRHWGSGASSQLLVLLRGKRRSLYLALQPNEGLILRSHLNPTLCHL
jgi:hypothetical protein